jgi:HK97 family phage prohead protease/HK97 family phage major capsid protein
MKNRNIQNKTLFFDTPLTFKAVDSEEGDDELIIEGAASTDNIDRMGDIIEASAWNEKAINAYKQNPIILAFHNHEKPVGTATEVKNTGRGLALKAKISKGAPEVWHLVKDGVLKAFSVGFIVKDADYDKEKDIFRIKEVELLEVSVVSVPANPYTTFNVSKSFKNSSEFEEFKKSFIDEDNNIEEINTMADTKNVENKAAAPEIDLEAIAATIKAQLKAEQEAEAKVKAAEEAKRVEMQSMVEQLVKDATKAVEEDNSAKLKELQKALDEKESEIKELVNATRESKMSYSEKGGSRDGLSTAEKDGLVLLSKLLKPGQPIENTKYFKQIREKSGMEHWDSSVQTAWEEEFSTRVHNEMREQLKVEPLFSTMPMSTPTMYMPTNPEAGYGEWIPTGDYRSDVLGSNGAAANSSTGLAVDHELKENVITAHKLATKEFIGYEEEEDSIVPLLPIIRDAISRRMARSADLALLRGAGGGTDPITGLTGMGASVTDVSFSLSASGAAGDVTDVTDSHFITARKNLGIYGLEPNNLVWVVSHELYYHMMDLAVFKTMDQIGDRATIVTGQVGAIYGTPVVVSQQFDNTNIATPAAGTPFGLLVRPANFVKGELRSMRVEQWLDVPNQKRGLVATRRFGFKDLDVGEGVAKFVFAT